MMWDLHQHPSAAIYSTLSISSSAFCLPFSVSNTCFVFYSRRQEEASPDAPLNKTQLIVSLPPGHTTAHNLFFTSYFCKDPPLTKLQLPSLSSSILSVLLNISLGSRIPALLFSVFKNRLAKKAPSLAAFLSAFDDCVSRFFCLPDSNGCINEPGSLPSITEGIS